MTGAIEATGLAIEELEEEIRADNERRYAFREMLKATDRVLWHLEELNLGEVETLPSAVRIRMRATLDVLPGICIEVFRDSVYVQEVLDSVFEVQERLFRWRDPGRDLVADAAEEAELLLAEEPATLESRVALQIVDALTAAGAAGLLTDQLEAAVTVHALFGPVVKSLVEAGILRWEPADARGWHGRPGRRPRRYFLVAVGEGSG